MTLTKFPTPERLNPHQKEVYERLTDATICARQTGRNEDKDREDHLYHEFMHALGRR